VREAVADAALGDDEERRHLVDPEALGEVWMLVHVHRVEDERSVIPAPLEYLGDEPFDAAAASAHLGVEEDESRARRRALRYGYGSLGHSPPSVEFAYYGGGVPSGPPVIDRVPILRRC
jgi:hypothetical protein